MISMILNVFFLPRMITRTLAYGMCSSLFPCSSIFRGFVESIARKVYQDCTNYYKIERFSVMPCIIFNSSCGSRGPPLHPHVALSGDGDTCLFPPPTKLATNSPTYQPLCAVLWLVARSCAARCADPGYGLGPRPYIDQHVWLLACWPHFVPFFG